jgi:hypothetical protein
MNEVNHWRFETLFQAKEEGTSATYIIDWTTGNVWFPTIHENTWSGGWHRAEPGMAGECLDLNIDFNPLIYDYSKIRRRIEDALRKTSQRQLLLECAKTLGVKLT